MVGGGRRIFLRHLSTKSYFSISCAEVDVDRRSAASRGSFVAILEFSRVDFGSFLVILGGVKNWGSQISTIFWEFKAQNRLRLHRKGRK